MAVPSRTRLATVAFCLVAVGFGPAVVFQAPVMRVAVLLAAVPPVALVRPYRTAGVLPQGPAGNRILPGDRALAVCIYVALIFLSRIIDELY